MDAFLTAVTKDVDATGRRSSRTHGLPEPRVSYDWIPAGQTAASVCGDDSGGLGDDAAAYCPGDDTIYISQQFADRHLQRHARPVAPRQLAGLRQACPATSRSPTSSPTSTATRSRTSSACSTSTPTSPTMDFELQADCYAGDWAKYANDKGELDDGDVDEALDAALAVGDFETNDPGHHGTPEQREEAWKTGFQSGDPQACMSYLAS